jgi:hypothetical protein
VDLDFVGWRYVELLLRERDSERLSDYTWPYSGAGGSHAVYRNAVDRAHLSEVNVLLNEIPARGQVDILLSPIHSLPSRKVQLANPQLQIGAATVTFPVTLQSGQYIELEEMDDCVLYDERGELIGRFRPQAEPVLLLAEGPSSLRFDCEAPKDASARAEVTVVSLGPPFGGCRDESEINWNCLAREYDVPRVVMQTDGIDNVWSIVRRADGPKDLQDRAPVLELEIKVEQLGRPEKKSEMTVEEAHLDTPIFTIGDASVRFPVRLHAGQRLICRDHNNWRLLDADGDEVSSGELSGSFPNLVPGANQVTLAFEKELCSNFRVLVKTAKVY